VQASLAIETRRLALDVHTLLGELDVARWRAELEVAVRGHIARIEARLETVRTMPALAEDRLDQVQGSLDEIATVLHAEVPSAGLSGDQLRAEWAAFRTRLQPAYEAMANALQAQAIHVPTRRPTNYLRNVLHMGSAGLALVLVQLLLPEASLPWVGAGLGIMAWSLELGRRLSPRMNQLLMAMLGPFAHPHESYRTNSATWYCTALLLLGLTGSKTLMLVAMGVLGFADPAAALVGRRWGSIKLVHGRSLQGSLAFLLTGIVAAGTVLLATRPELGPTAWLAMALPAALLGALAELFSIRLDDNLSVPAAAAAGAGVAATLLGLPL